jgi:hypothetical protein
VPPHVRQQPAEGGHGPRRGQRRLAERFAQRGNQTFEVSGESGVADLEGVALRKRAQLVGQLRFGGHRRAIEQQRHHDHASCKAAGHLFAHQVVRVAQPRRGAFALALPALADQHQQHLRFAHRALDHLGEALARIDVIDVDEHAVGAEVAREFVVDGARVTGGVVAAVADEDLRGSHHERGVFSCLDQRRSTIVGTSCSPSRTRSATLRASSRLG